MGKFMGNTASNKNLSILGSSLEESSVIPDPEAGQVSGYTKLPSENCKNRCLIRTFMKPPVLIL